MLIQVLTTHGKTFWCADIELGPRPTRLWVGDKGGPRGLQRITAAQLARMEGLSGDNGPLYIEQNPALAEPEKDDDLRKRLAEREQELEFAAASLDELGRSLEAAERHAAGLQEVNEGLTRRARGLEERLAEAEKRATETAARADDAEKRAAEAEVRADEAEKRVGEVEKRAGAADKRGRRKR
jgi:hypothetical protein